MLAVLVVNTLHLSSTHSRPTNKDVTLEVSLKNTWWKPVDMLARLRLW